MYVYILVIVLPGRVARLDAEVRMESLILKGIFVRYISHEIRYCRRRHCSLTALRQDYLLLSDVSQLAIECGSLGSGVSQG